MCLFSGRTDGLTDICTSYGIKSPNTRSKRLIYVIHYTPLFIKTHFEEIIDEIKAAAASSSERAASSELNPPSSFLMFADWTREYSMQRQTN